MAGEAQWAAACEKFRASLTLSEVECQRDPDTEPYRSKYRARDLLRDVRALLGPHETPSPNRHHGDDDDDREEARAEVQAPARRPPPPPPPPGSGPGLLRAARLSAVELQLGLNHTDTEEPSAGEEHLRNCLRLLRPPHRLHPLGAAIAVHAQNNLGILWCDRGEMERGQTYLESAEALYKQYTKEIGSPPLDPTEHFLPEEEQLSEQERSKRFEKAHTHTLYYLAQVYQHLNMTEKAAQYCHTTLKRQLESGGYHPVEWAINAATLSQYYLNEQCFMESRHCLSAASVIFSQTEQSPSGESPQTEEDQQNLCQRKAEIARCWIKYCLNLLQSARKSLEDNIGELDPDKQGELRARRKSEEDARESGRKRAVLFGTSDVRDSIMALEEKVSCASPLDFEEAREVFLVGQNYVAEAKEYFQVDGHVTDHIEVVQDHSALFKALAFFEADYERRCKMHKRRVDMLEPLSAELNPRYYLLVVRQLQFELAETSYEMMDLKVALAERLAEPAPRAVKKINALARAAIGYYQLFLDSLRGPDRAFPERLEEDVLRPAMVARFHMARLYGKLIPGEGRRELENLQTSLAHYAALVDYCEKHPEAVPAVRTELELSREMVGLLPARMERLRAKLAPLAPTPRLPPPGSAPPPADPPSPRPGGPSPLAAAPGEALRPQ
ncbi:KIF-binding protein [Tachyglossus aculeatus]|uniref:KIF-binding protein n=1 Tax=Tachyglossus aculeatus TaxID=9261 RepID=UPI0018F651DB|nr:KIF-binding protein [Tachyglossus aculeatus]